MQIQVNFWGTGHSCKSYRFLVSVWTIGLAESAHVCVGIWLWAPERSMLESANSWQSAHVQTVAHNISQWRWRLVGVFIISCVNSHCYCRWWCQAWYSSEWILGWQIWTSLLWCKSIQPPCSLKQTTPSYLLQKAWKPKESLWTKSLWNWTWLHSIGHVMSCPSLEGLEMLPQCATSISPPWFQPNVTSPTAAPWPGFNAACFPSSALQFSASRVLVQPSASARQSDSLSHRWTLFPPKQGFPPWANFWTLHVTTLHCQLVLVLSCVCLFFFVLAFYSCIVTYPEKKITH